MTPENEHILALLREAGLPAACEIAALAGGGNNRVYRVVCGNRSVLLKAYFQHPDDPRDRLGAEFAFLHFAWENGLRCVPRPLACDPLRKLGLYEFVEGRPLTAGEIGLPEVQQAIDFFRELNRHKRQPAARELRNASEACFTLEQHLACVQRRVERLCAADEARAFEARTFVSRELAPAWERIRGQVLSQAAAAGLSPDAPIPREDECLSPSDFGFHNVLRTADGRLRFLDFEYSGWDDPAKTACDFCCQPALPAPPALHAHFARAVAADLSDPALHLRRIAWLTPVYRVKWCCIMLNDFLPVGNQRRAFAHARHDAEDRKQTQLHKARHALETLATISGG